MTFEQGNRQQRGKELEHDRKIYLMQMIFRIQKSFQNMSKIARAFDVHRSTVYSWRDCEGGTEKAINRAERIIKNNNIN